MADSGNNSSALYILYSMDNNNSLIDLGDQVVQAPKGDEIRVRDPEIYMKRLQDLQTPSQRIREFLWSIVNFREQPTHEAYFIRTMALSGGVMGWIWGGFLGSEHIHSDYIRRHNASVFDSNFLARRHHSDTFVYTMICRGAKYGIRTGLLCASAGLISFGSINYRNELYYPDWLIGFAALGATTRLWLGLRGVIAGGAFGIIAGNLGYGLARGYEKVTGYSVTQLRYLNHVNYLRKREAMLDYLRRQREGYDKDALAKP